MKSISYEMTWLIVGLVVIVAIIALGLTMLIGSINRPEQHEQAEVIGKKREVDGGETYGGPSYLVDFKFPDGSVKEFDVSKVGIGVNRREFYNSMHKGEMGILTYKEKEKIINGVSRFAYREFISFEKDPEFGGLKVERDEMPKKTQVIILFGVLVLVLVVFTMIMVVIYKKRSFP